MSTKGYRLRERGTSWQAIFSRKVTGTGKRVMISRKTKTECAVAAETKLQEYRDYGADVTKFKADELRAARTAFDLLKERGFAPVSVIEAARQYIQNNDIGQTQCSVKEVFNEFLSSRKGADVASLTLRTYRQIIGRFAESHADKMISTIQPYEIESWLDRIKLHGETRRGYRNHLCIFWRFAIERKYCKDNAAAAVAKVKVDQQTPEILSTPQVRALMVAAKNYKKGKMIPYFAIGCFAGLRPCEICKTNWSDINFDTKEIYLPPKVCKTGHDRFVSMSENLLAWLALVPEESRHGLIPCSRYDFEETRERAGLLASWHHDVMRHSAASHLYAQSQNAATTTAQMGHGLSIFMKHYKRAVTKHDGQEYFKILPTDEEQKTAETSPPA